VQILLQREKKYNELLDYFGMPVKLGTPEAVALHERILRIMDGREPDPRQ
jgi:hypothetical protein